MTFPARKWRGDTAVIRVPVEAKSFLRELAHRIDQGIIPLEKIKKILEINDA